MLSLSVALKSILRSPWSTLRACAVVFTAFCCRLPLTTPGYRFEANRLAATGLIMAAGITLNGKGLRVAAGVEEGVQGAVNEAHGLYNWPVPKQFPALSKPSAQTAPKSPLRSAAVNMVLAVDELG